VAGWQDLIGIRITNSGDRHKLFFPGRIQIHKILFGTDGASGPGCCGSFVAFALAEDV